MKNLLFITMLVLIVTACTTDNKFKEQLSNSLKNDPTILTDAIKANPTEFMQAVQQAAMKAQEAIGKNRQADEQNELEKSFASPLQPKITQEDAISGDFDAPITLVAYSDFECPYCSKSHSVVNELKKEYGDKIRYVFKHLPLDFHKFALPAAKYFEAIRKQDSAKAFAFHDLVFESQKQLQKGTSFLDAMAKKVGANMITLKKDLNSSEIIEKINKDSAEAKKFKIEGTPGFIINGIPVRGAYPAEYFKNIVSELKKRGQLKI